MIQIDMPMPENCYVCPLMMWCDPCEGYSNHCVFGWEIDCGYIVYKSYQSKEVIADHSNGTYTSRHKDCPLREVDIVLDKSKGFTFVMDDMTDEEYFDFLKNHSIMMRKGATDEPATEDR